MKFFIEWFSASVDVGHVSRFRPWDPPSHSFFPKIKWILEIRHFGYFSLGRFRYEFCHLWVRFWDGSWCVVNLKSYSFQNGYGYVQEAKISAREAQLPIRSEKHLKLKFWQTSRFLNVFSDFPLVQATLDIDVARCECDINMIVGALYTLGLSKHDMIKGVVANQAFFVNWNFL